MQQSEQQSKNHTNKSSIQGASVKEASIQEAPVERMSIQEALGQDISIKEAPDQRASAQHLEGGIILKHDAEGLSLVKNGMSIRADFYPLLSRISHNKLHRELLVRAAKIKGAQNPIAIDATAGFGEDSFLLAAAGFQVYLIEHDPIIAQLLRDALARAAAHDELASITARMTLIEANSIDELLALKEPQGQSSSLLAEALKRDFPSELNIAPDVIYLDPMFPARTKSAAVKKKFQLIHQLEKPCEDEAALLDAALAARPRKIVIKRPLKGPFLSGIKPSYSLKGKAIRYDCLVFC